MQELLIQPGGLRGYRKGQLSFIGCLTQSTPGSMSFSNLFLGYGHHVLYLVSETTVALKHSKCCGIFVTADMIPHCSTENLPFNRTHMTDVLVHFCAISLPTILHSVCLRWGANLPSLSKDTSWFVSGKSVGLHRIPGNSSLVSRCHRTINQKPWVLAHNFFKSFL